MRFLFWIPFLVFVYSCGPDTPETIYDYRLSPSDFKPYPLPGDTGVQKFVLSWENPTEKKDLKLNRIYLDTNGSSGENWNSLFNDPKKAPVYLDIPADSGYSNSNGTINSFSRPVPARDSILISFSADGSAGPNIRPVDVISNMPYYILDSSGRIDTTDLEYHFALVSEYANGARGQPRFTHFPVFDNIKPEPIRPEYEFTDKALFINWNRPRDPVSFFEPEADTGIIKGYILILQDVKNHEDTIFSKLSIDSIRFGTGTGILSYSRIRPALPLKDLISSSAHDTSTTAEYTLFFPDNQRRSDIRDSNKIRVEIYGLVPQQKYRFQVYAVDSSGNEGKSYQEIITFVTTDTTKPTAPIPGPVASEKNWIQISWKPSSDSGFIVNKNIMEYRLVKIVLADSQILRQGDTTAIVIKSADTSASYPGASFILEVHQDSEFVYMGTFYFLIPGKKHLFLLWAVDSSGYRSDTARINTSTLNANDSIPCPAGLVSINQPEEPFCIEPREHQDSSRNFSASVTRDEAREICSGAGLELCSKEQWERACNGDLDGLKHRYGIQSVLLQTTQDSGSLKSISSPQSILQTRCNQAAGDEEMALHEELRNTECMTNEGVFDMAGNLSEWVDGDQLLMKGGNYLKPTGLDITQIQALAECSKNLFPRQKRPDYIAPCISKTPNIRLTFKSRSGLDSIVCPQFSKGVSEIKIQQDTLSLKAVFFDGSSRTIIFRESKIDSSPYPSGIEMNDTALLVAYILPADADPAAIDFSADSLFLIDTVWADSSDSILSVNSSWIGIIYKDTLSYSEFRFSSIPLNADSLPSTHPLLTREITSQWQIIPVQKLFAALKPAEAGKPASSKPAKPYYSHPSVGFRCCSGPLN